jgi:hypothetical protein
MTNIGILGPPNTWAINAEAYIPGEFALSMPNFGMRLIRRNIRRPVDTQVPIGPSTTDIRFKIPSSNIVTLDFRRGGIHVTVNVTVNAPHSARLPNFAWNMFYRFRLEQHNQYIEDRMYYNQQETFFYWTNALLDQFRTTGTGLYGAGSPSLRNAQSNGYEYILPIPTESLCKTVMPWFQLINVKGVYASSNLPDVWMIWDVAQPSDWIETYGNPDAPTGLTYQITKMEVEYEEITVESGMQGTFMKYWHTDSEIYPRIFFKSYQTFIYPMTQALRQTQVIDFKLNSFDFIAVTFRLANHQSDSNIWDKYETWLGPEHSSNSLPLLQYQWQINNNFWPDRPVDLSDPGNTEPYKKFLELFGNFYARFVHTEVTAIGPYSFKRDKFVIALDVKQFPFTSNIINPLSTAESTKSILLNLEFTAPPAAGLEMVVHANYWRMWRFASPSGKIVEW